MSDESKMLVDKIREQFDSAPYPRVPLDQSPKADLNRLFIYNLTTCHYLRYQTVPDPTNKLMLDVGCGSGYSTLTLATANPGAKVIGVDLSKNSIDLAQKRIQHHGLQEAVEFHVLALEDLPSLNMQFDYINCDELLYLFRNPATALSAMKAVLSPQGIIRSNLHSSLQRAAYYRAQELFKMMGLMDSNPGEMEMEIAVETMKALRDEVELKIRAWQTASNITDPGTLLMNYLFQGDQGFTVPQLFAFLEEAGLEFISMVNWRQWELLDLFKDPEDLPAFWAFSLPDLPIETRLHIFELLHPIHRLLDFWCGHPNAESAVAIPSEWSDLEWEKAKAYLHPQLRIHKLRDDVIDCIRENKTLEITQYLNLTSAGGKSIKLDTAFLSTCILPLLEGPQTVKDLVERSRQVHPIDPVSLQPRTYEVTFKEVKRQLLKLEVFLYVLLERQE